MQLPYAQRQLHSPCLHHCTIRAINNSAPSRRENIRETTGVKVDEWRYLTRPERRQCLARAAAAMEPMEQWKTKEVVLEHDRRAAVLQAEKDIEAAAARAELSGQNVQ